MYTITNLFNGMMYVGKTAVTVVARLKSHHREKNKSYLSRAIRKYGWDNFEVKVVYEGVNEREINAVERGLIAEYGTFAPRGYNLTIGGDGVSGLKRPEFSKRMKGRTVSKETGDKISATKKTLGQGGDQKHMAMMVKKIRALSSRPVWCVETGQVWASIKSCSDDLGASIAQLQRCINSLHRTCQGKHFNDIEGINKPDPILGRIGHPIIEIGDCYVVEYESIKEASEFLGIKRGMIYRVCAGTRANTHGRIFQYNGDLTNISVR